VLAKLTNSIYYQPGAKEQEQQATRSPENVKDLGAFEQEARDYAGQDA